MTRLDDEASTERVFSQCAEMQSQVELAGMYLDKWKVGGSGAAGGPQPIELIQDMIFRPCRSVLFSQRMMTLLCLKFSCPVESGYRTPCC